tara:strand:- start:2134 stop:2547 length:414 start_codon:yes stop_codon:yes gene_type:complete
MRTVIKQTELPFMAAAKTKLSALEQLKKAANLTPTKKTVELQTGGVFEFWSTPLTMAENERAKQINKDMGNDGDLDAFALTLFVQKATDQNGTRLFQNGQIAEMKNELRHADLQALMLSVIQETPNATEERQVVDPK